MFENIARIWLNKWKENFNNSSDYTRLEEDIVEDLALTLVEVYEAGRSYGYDEGLEENLSELQW